MAGEHTTLVTIEKVEHNVDTGWYNIHARRDDGSKMRLSTKFAEKAQEAVSLKDKPSVRVWFDEKPSRGVNPHTNQPYPPDNWYERAELSVMSGNGGVAGIETVGGEVQKQLQDIPPAPRGEDPERSWRICLQTGGKLAVATLPHLAPEHQTFESQKAIAKAWGKFFYYEPTPPPLGAPAPPPFAGGDQGYEQPPPPTDDDIPF